MQCPIEVGPTKSVLDDAPGYAPWLSGLLDVDGAERRVVYDLINVIQGDAKLPQALIRDKRLETLHLLPASQTRDKDNLTAEGVEKVIGALRHVFDWVICDSPAGIERGATLAMRHADVAIVVTNPEVSSVRDSDRIIGLLDSTVVNNRDLVGNIIYTGGYQNSLNGHGTGVASPLVSASMARLD